MILDRAGRFQIPHEYLDSLKIKGNKIKVELDGGKIVITNPQQIEKVIHTEDN